MAQATGVQEYGNSMAIMLDDGNRLIALPTGKGVWLLDEVIVPPDPDPPTPGPSKFRWPFNPSTQGNGQVGEYGPRWGRMHWGFDFGSGGVTANTPIHAANAGRIVRNELHSGWGYHVVIDHGRFNGKNLYTLYAHMIRKSGVRVGSSVAKFATIGNVGNTGASQGNHLHWETYEGGLRQNQAINPRTFMSRYGE